MNTGMKLVLGFVAIIIAVSLIGSIATNAQAVTTKTYVANETVSIASARNVSGENQINTSAVLTLANPVNSWRAETSDCYITDFVYRNQTGATMAATTDYIFTTSTGSFTLKNVLNFNSTALNTTTASYSYCGNDYLNSSWGRTVLNLVVGFFAIAILGAGLWLFYDVAKETGILGK